MCWRYSDLSAISEGRHGDPWLLGTNCKIVGNGGDGICLSQWHSVVGLFSEVVEGCVCFSKLWEIIQDEIQASAEVSLDR